MAKPSSMHDRTHKGGAVLWFLRKHAPMPSSPLDIAADSRSRQSVAPGPLGGDSIAAAAASLTKPGHSTRMQAKFLHEALLSIGVEMDDCRHGRDVTALRSARHRDELRRTFAAHADLEYQSLKRRAAAREAEIAGLRQQVAQVERLVQATRVAAARRSIRLRMSTDQSSNPLALTHGLLRSKQKLMQTAESMVWDAEDAAIRRRGSGGKDGKDKSMTFEETLQAKITGQFDEEQTLRSTLEKQIRAFDQQTVQRKATEASLFGTHAEILALRSKTLKTEARVTRLANDLRRVYRQLPDVFQQKLAQSAQHLDEEKSKELSAMQAKHYAEHLKYLSSKDLRQRTLFDEAVIAKTVAKHQLVEEALAGVPAVLQRTFDRLKTCSIASGSLREVWGAAAGLTTSKEMASFHEAVQGSVEDLDLRVQLLLNTVLRLLPEDEQPEHLVNMGKCMSMAMGKSASRVSDSRDDASVASAGEPASPAAGEPASPAGA